MKTDILYSITSFENRAAYKIMWKNMLEPDRAQMTIGRMRIAGWIPVATDSHSEYVIFIVFSLQMVAQTRLSVTLCAHYLVCCKCIVRQG